jgi:DNA polymerase bacteriophage-type
VKNLTPVSFDFETRSELDLKSVGAWVYSMHPSTQVICVAWSIDKAPPEVEIFDPFEKPDIPEFLACPDEYMLEAWNSFFEYCIMRFTLKLKPPPFEQWSDTMAKAAALSLPLSLGKCASALGLPEDKQKDKRGKDLINKLSKPRKDGSFSYNIGLINEMAEYCRQDVVVEQAVSSIVGELHPTERKLWVLDQKINERGVPFDVKSAEHCIKIRDKELARMEPELHYLTDFKADQVSQIARIKAFIKTRGVEVPSFGKVELKEFLDTPGIPEDVRRILEIRQIAGRSSLAKFDKIKLMAYKGRINGILQFCGALRTGRWAGRLVQPHNFPRPAFENVDLCIELLSYEDANTIDVFFGDPLEALATCLRGMICAPKGKVLFICDFSAIEARVLPWLSGQEDVLEVFRGHGKIYEATAAKIYKIPIEEVSSDQRFVGKVVVLSLGFQGGRKALQLKARESRIEISNKEACKIVKGFRDSNPKTVSFWADLETAAKNAVQSPGEVFTVRRVAYVVRGGFLFCRLPSGRKLAYLRPRIDRRKVEYEDENGAVKKFYADQITFLSVGASGSVVREATYGGKLTENVTQAVARDVMGAAMLRCDERGYPPILTVHDEIVSEVDEGFGNMEEYSSILCEATEWSAGLPIAAEGFVAKRWGKG